MRHKAKLKINERTTDGYYCAIEGKHYLILDDAEVIGPDPALDLVITGFVEIDPDTLQPVHTFGAAIAAKRKHLGFSQEKLARKAGLSRNYLSQIERDEAQNISVDIFLRLGDALGIEESELIEMWRGSNANR